MSQKYIQKRASGISEAKANVKVKNVGNFTIEWICDNYKGDNMALQICIPPGETEPFEYDYARRVFGDWEIDYDRSPEYARMWNGMIGDTRQKSPTNDGMLPQVEIYNNEGELLWDAKKQMELWLERNKHSKDAFLSKHLKSSPLGKAPMPSLLRDATYDQLKAMWLESWGTKMPAGMQSDIAKEVLMPRLTESQIKDVIAREYEAAREHEAATS